MISHFDYAKKDIILFNREMSVALHDTMGTDMTPYVAAKASITESPASVAPEELQAFLKMLMSKGHWSPFEQCEVAFRVKAPIFVFRQLFRHRTLSVNERSARYAEVEGQFYCPSYIDNELRKRMIDLNTQAYDLYLRSLKEGVPREVARMVLPVSMMSNALIKVDLRNFIHLATLRLSPYAQREIRWIVQAMWLLAHNKFPMVLDCAFSTNVTLAEYSLGAMQELQEEADLSEFLSEDGRLPIPSGTPFRACYGFINEE